ncbi:hypothetical protein FB451DRAFT_1564485, partial [Mycena latifolia]
MQRGLPPRPPHLLLVFNAQRAQQVVRDGWQHVGGYTKPKLVHIACRQTGYVNQGPRQGLGCQRLQHLRRLQRLRWGLQTTPQALPALPIQSLADWIGRAHPIRRSSPLPPSTSLFQSLSDWTRSAHIRCFSVAPNVYPPLFDTADNIKHGAISSLPQEQLLRSNSPPPLPPSATLGGPHGSANSASLTSISTANDGSDDEHGSSKSPGPNAASPASYTSYTSYTSDGPKLFDGFDHTHPEMTAWLMI